MNIMLDIETLGINPGCVILSIAAVPFHTNYDYIEPFYKKISILDSESEGFTTDQATVEWWHKQNPLTRREAYSGTASVKDVLAALSTYLIEMPTAPVIWGNGADFDNAIVAYAYKKLGIQLPWSYKNNMCYRTLKNLYPQIPYSKPVNAHNAFEDAKAQAVHAQTILQWKDTH